MLNKSAVLTDKSKMLTSLYTDGCDIIFYDTGKMELLPERIFSLLSDEKKLASIAEAGYASAAKNATWENLGQRFLSILSV